MKLKFSFKTTDQARDYAIDWQTWQSEQSMSYGEMIVWQEYFQMLGKEFGLTEEFKENGII